MAAKNLRPRVIDEAKRYAAEYHREFRAAIDSDGIDWVVQAWAVLRRDFRLSARETVSLWPVYWRAFCEESARLASVRAVAD